jgi:TP901 family phage tail tape measure protein
MSKNVVDMTLRANMDLSNISSEISQIQGYLKKLALSPETKRSFDNLFDEAIGDLEKLQKRIDKGFKTKGDVTGFEKASSSLEASFKKIENKLFKLYNLSDKEIFKLDPNLKGDLEAIERKFANIAEDFPKDIKEGLKSISGEIGKLTTTSQKKVGKEILSKVSNKDYEGALKLAQQKLKIQERLRDTSSGETHNTTKIQAEAYEKIVVALQNAILHIDQFNNKAKYLETEKAERLAQTFNIVKDNIGKAQEVASRATSGFEQLSNEIKDTGEETVNFNSELDSIKQRVQYFFSLTNSVMLFRRILQDTINTTKELDAAMTETAVVTDFSVADMWKDLPRYTNIAKELGTTIKGVYETMTLYYQQGLKTEEVVEVGTETLKMARIAGLDYANATDFMTAALRGFNMEVNELNAQRVNDVYSELAAITAADTQEIATAMTKTASIASSANMEFETTAAFLSQIIETTRESAETAGTALKTVIARFTELKKDPAEIGEVDGEIVDANKIETALRTIDVALRDTSGQFRELDDVFLDISAKWAGLDTNTQRYIATMAAGSRQQSRFIAMMSDYSRTMELVNAANNSAGASQKQFDKTLESLEAKLNQLKDAWDQFTMGIANNTLIKAGVDALTALINLLNKMTERLPGPLKGIGNLLLLIGGFKGGEKLIKAFSASFLKDIVDIAKGAKKAGDSTGISFISALKEQFKNDKIDKIFKPLQDYFKKKKGQKIFEASFDFDKEGDNLDSKVEEFSGMPDDESKDFWNNYNDFINKSNTLKEEASKFSKIGLNDDLAKLAAQKQINLEEIKQVAQQKIKQIYGEENLKNKQEELRLMEKQLVLEKLGANENDIKPDAPKEKKSFRETFNKNNLKQKWSDLDKNLTEKATGKLQSINEKTLGTGGLKSNLVNKGVGKLISLIGSKGILATLGGVAAAIVAVGVAIKVTSHLVETQEEKIARIDAAIEHSSQSMQDARSKIDEIKTSMDNLTNLEDEFDGLIKGTDQWKEKLIEVNNQVLETLEKFPQLAQFLSQGENGELTISPEGWDSVLEEQQKKLNTSLLTNTISSNQKEALTLGKRIREEAISNELTKGGASRFGIEQLAKKFAESDTYLTANGDYSEVLKNTINLDDDLKAILEKEGGIAEFNNLVNMIKTSENANNARVDALASQIVSQNEGIAGTKYERGIAKAIASQIEVGENGDLPEEITRVLNEKYGNYGADGQAINLDKSEIWKAYAKKEGLDYKEVKEKYKDDDDGTYALALELASEDVADKLVSNADLLIKGLKKIGTETSKIGKDWGKSFENLISGNLTEADIINLEDSSVKFSDLPQEIKDYFNNSSKQYNDFIDKQVETAKEQLASANEILENLSIKDEINTSNLSASATQGLAKNLQEVFYKSGPEGVKAIVDSFNQVTDGMSKDQAEKFTAALNAVDWTSIDGLEDLKHTLYDMGVYVDDATLKTLTDDIIDFNKATNAVDLSKLTAQLEANQDLLEEISDRDRGERSFGKEDKEKLVSLGIDESFFVGYGDSWRYVGTSLDTLTEAIKANTDAILKSTIDELKNKLDTAKAATAAQSSGVDLVNYGVKNENDRQKLLQGFLNSLAPGTTTIAGYDVEQLKTLTSGNLDANQEKFLGDFLKILADAVGTEESVQTQLDSTVRQQGIFEYSNKTTAETVAAATQKETSENKVEIQNATNALLYKAADYAELSDEIRKYNQAVKDGNTALANNIKKEIASKVVIQERAKAFDDLDDKVEEHIQNLKKTKNGTDAYKNILGDLTEDLNEVFDTDLTLDFFENTPENLILLENALEGSQEAWDALILKIQEAQLATIDFEEDYDIMGANVSSITEALNGLKFNIEGEADMTKVVQSLLEAEMTGEQVAEFLEKLGYTNIDFEVTGEDVDLTSIEGIEDLKNKKWSLKATNVNIPAARQYSSFGSGGAYSGTKSGDPDGSGNEWENPYDSFYNINADINKLIEERNDLEKEHEKILKDENATVKDIANSYTNQIQSYGQEIALQKEMLRLRQQEQKQLLKDNSDLQKYAWIKDGKVQIDFEKIDKITDEELGQRIEDYISALEKNTEEIEKAENSITDAEIAAKKLIDDWQQDTADFEREVFDAIVYAREKEIEGMEDIAETFDRSAQDLVSAIQEEIDARRQDRENKETEEDILDKERRLAYLQQDTSGANDAEILQLQKELTEQKQDYTDTLIDQKISELEKQNEEASRQREKQIQIAQAQLKYDQENGVIAKQVRDLVNANTADGSANWNAVMQLLMDKDGFKSLTETEQKVWKDKVTSDFKNALSFLTSGEEEGLKSLLKNIQTGDNYNQYSENNKNPETTDVKNPQYTQPPDDNNNNNDNETPKPVPVDDTKIASDGKRYFKIKGLWYNNSDVSNFDDDENTAILKEGAKGINSILIEYAKVSGQRLIEGDNEEDAYNKLEQMGHQKVSSQGEKYLYYGSGLYLKISDIQSAHHPGGTVLYFNDKTPLYKRYKTGGLADYTGPAWLDGTKSRPELVLNQKDTQNFLQLKDVLGSFMKNKTNVTNNNNNNNTQTGDTNFEISITVEKMNSDYDVEDVANKIKQMISSDAMYRNSNFISRLR